jgi:hypothetical protein
MYLSTMQTAELVRPEGDLFLHLTAQDLGSGGEVSAEDNEGAEESELEGADVLTEQESTDGEEAVEEEDESAPARKAPKGSPPRAVFTVNVQLDASLDTEKLEKQLALLKKYGAL